MFQRGVEPSVGVSGRKLSLVSVFELSLVPMFQGGVTRAEGGGASQGGGGSSGGSAQDPRDQPSHRCSTHGPR